MKKNIPQGPTFKGIISYVGLLFIIGGIVSIAHNFLAAGILELICGIFLFLNIKGTIIDPENGIVKPYLYFLFIKLGKQYNLKDINEVMVARHKDSVRMNSRGTSGEYRTRSYNVLLMSDSGIKILIKQFSKKEQALVLQKELNKELNLQRI